MANTKQSYSRLNLPGLIFRVIFFWMAVFPCGAWVCHADDDTGLMFVGENLEIITIASGREEGAWKAPAVADVITSGEFVQKGDISIEDVLNTEPGFLISDSETGHHVYLRGILDSVLFLNDAVPMGSNLNKNYNRMSPYMSLAPVKRIEIIRGPGSVLWGPDAFAGIVNIVSFTGKDFQGIKTGIRGGNAERGQEAWLLWGQDGSRWDSFISVSGGKANPDERQAYDLTGFWGPDNREFPIDPGQRYGNETIESPGFFNATGNFGLEDVFRLSFNTSFYKIPYTRQDDMSGRTLSWNEENQAFTGSVKMEGGQQYRVASGFRWTTYFSWFDKQTQIVDLTLTDHDRIFFGELVHDQSVLNGQGLFTVGVSLRQEEVTGLPVWDSYYPDYFTDDNVSFLPSVHLYDYSLTTTSIFSQYQHTLGDLMVWTGVRGDDHNASGQKLSYNTGLAWNPSETWVYKLTYGNAYRTPVARQLQESKNRMENIQTLSTQLGWRPGPETRLDITGYFSRLRDGYIQDPAIGLSESISQDLYGIEIKGRCKPSPRLDMGAGLSWSGSSGSDTHFRYNDYSYFDFRSGQIVKHFLDIYEPYDRGAGFTLSADMVYQFNHKYSFRAECRYTHDRTARYLLDEAIHTYEGFWLVHTGLTVKDIMGSGMTLDLSVTNVLDIRYEQPGAYGVVTGDPFAVSITLEKKW